VLLCCSAELTDQGGRGGTSGLAAKPAACVSHAASWPKFTAENPQIFVNCSRALLKSQSRDFRPGWFVFTDLMILG
jgi:hypothetical protein